MHNLERKYEYRRHLPHYQKAGRAIFITFRKGNPIPFTAETRDAILSHCLHDRGKRYELHAAVVMPEHVHLLLTPVRDSKGWPYSLPQILKLLKGASARSINKLLNSSGPVWQEESFDHVLRSQESFEQKKEYIRQNPVRRGLAKRPEDYRWLWIESQQQQKTETDRAGRESVGRTLLSVAFDVSPESRKNKVHCAPTSSCCTISILPRGLCPEP